MTPSQLITTKSTRLFFQVEALADGRMEVRIEFLNLPMETLHHRDKSALRLRVQFIVVDLIVEKSGNVDEQ